jgi:GTP-binding protein
VAFLGRSNVGKSSLLNALAGQRSLARVSARPGCTQLVNFFRVGDEMYFADLPGYGFARVPQAVKDGFERLVTSYLLGRAALRLCVFLVDARHEPMPGDLALREFLDHHGLRYVVAATKADKLGRGRLQASLAALRAAFAARADAVLPVSAESGAGLPELWRALRAATAPADSRIEHGR